VHRSFLVKSFDELKIKLRGIEAGDVYIRHFGKVMLAEVKSTSLYDNEKYGGTAETLYKNDRNKFFASFGVDQLVNNIKEIRDNMKFLDLDFGRQKNIRIWPVIIFNEKALQSPLMAQIFNKRSQELLGNYKLKGIYIYPLTLIHIGDLEQMQGALEKNPNRLWELLTYNIRAKFLPPFYNSLNGNGIKHDYSIVKGRVADIFDKYKATPPNL
jgi:hypothetical protein